AALRHEKGARRLGFPLPTFEEAVVSLLREVNVREVLGQADGPDEGMVLSGKLRAVEDAIAGLSPDLDEHGESRTLFKRLREREAQRKELAAQLARARAKAAHPLSESWGEAKTLLDALKGDKARLRFRAVLRRLVDGIWCLFVQRGRQDRLAA